MAGLFIVYVMHSCLFCSVVSIYCGLLAMIKSDIGLREMLGASILGTDNFYFFFCKRQKEHAWTWAAFRAHAC